MSITHATIKSLFSSAVSTVASQISDYAVNPQKNFTRNRQLLADKLISLMVAEGSGSTKNELLDFYGMKADSPSSSAFIQQRTKLKPEALQAVFENFNNSINSVRKMPKYRFLAADGSTATLLFALSG